MARFKDAKRTVTRTVGYGYVGRWCDDTMGWMLPNHLGGDRGRAEGISDHAQEHAGDGVRFELCRITVEVVKGARAKILRKPKATP